MLTKELMKTQMPYLRGKKRKKKREKDTNDRWQGFNVDQMAKRQNPWKSTPMIAYSKI